MRLSTVLPIAVPLVAALALGACSKEPAGPKTAEQVKSEVAQMVKPQPGQYQVTIKTIDFQIPGIPPEQSAKFKEMFANSGQSKAFCMTQAESDKGYKDFTKKLAQGDCTYDRFEANGGTLDAKLTCQTGKGMTAVIEMKGTMATDGSQMKMKMEQSGGPKGPIKMEMDMVSKRIGDCPV